MRKVYDTEPLAPESIHPLITQSRDTGTGHYIVTRQYSDSDMEVIAMRLDADDSLKRGGGARRKNDDKDAMDELTLAKSQQRSRRLVKIKCRAGQVDRMLTLTYRELMTDYEKGLKDFKRFIRSMRKRYGAKFYYIAVPEWQKRGALHFHLAIKGYYSINTIRRLWRRAVGDVHNRGGADSVGNVDITNPRRHGKNSWNPQRIAQYISKYVTKNESVDFNRKRYLSGGAIPEPVNKNGWLACTDMLHIILDEIFRFNIRRQPDVSVEMDGYYSVIYKST